MLDWLWWPVGSASVHPEVKPRTDIIAARLHAETCAMPPPYIACEILSTTNLGGGLDVLELQPPAREDLCTTSSDRHDSMATSFLLRYYLFIVFSFEGALTACYAAILLLSRGRVFAIKSFARILWAAEWTRPFSGRRLSSNGPDGTV